MSHQRLRVLLDRLLTNDCSVAEKNELFQLVETLEDEPHLKDELENAWMRYDKPSHLLPAGKSAEIIDMIINDGQASVKRKRRLLPFFATAAAVVLLAVLGTVWFLLPGRKKAPIVATVETNIAAPDKSRATITLANGKKVLLDEVQQGILATESGAKVVMKKDGQLVYENMEENTNAPVAYNTLNNPRGSRVINLTLPDGSRVWLNAGSSITYPTQFRESDRRVTMTGEAYFEVQHISGTWPNGVPRERIFAVDINGTTEKRGTVWVIGTHFNVKAYEDEEFVKTTLLEGKVSVAQPLLGKQVPPTMRPITEVLKPGEQATMKAYSAIAINHSADIEQTMAWKEGLFDYKKSYITEVLRDAARWYDIEIVYEGNKPADTFTGGIERTATLNELLTILKMTGVKFRLEGKRLIVMSGK